MKGTKGDLRKGRIGGGAGWQGDEEPVSVSRASSSVTATTPGPPRQANHATLPYHSAIGIQADEGSVAFSPCLTFLESPS
ncbi:hypothetical protein E2C01_074292 [Portunus trituberculatus]|uniref:Uncharacterized protein n=1 Tax=Portunus trituberculatus TaxID=210409 RepID=A0A5B7IFY1_PORTR|nr:hypothetical protein [Portunus trituberculatus]